MRDKLSDEDWEMFYAGNDGTVTFYIDLVNGTFTGGQVITMDAKNDGVGLPAENPNLSEATQQAADEAFELIKNGTIVVPTELDEVTAMLEDLGFDASHLNLSGN